MIHSKDLKELLLVVHKVFPLPAGFKGTHAFLLQPCEQVGEGLWLTLGVWGVHKEDGKVKNFPVTFDAANDLINEELLREVRATFESQYGAVWED